METLDMDWLKKLVIPPQVKKDPWPMKKFRGFPNDFHFPRTNGRVTCPGIIRGWILGPLGTLLHIIQM